MNEARKTVLFDIDAILNRLDVGENQKVAELGCGNFGWFVWPLARLVGRRGLVYAVDIIKSTLEEIRRQALSDNLPQVKPIWSNLEIFKATKIETSSLDGALLVNVLHQSNKKIDLLREAIRLLKRGGRLLVVEWRQVDTPFGPPADERVKVDSLKTALPKLGLDLNEEFAAGPFHYGLLLTKL